MEVSAANPADPTSVLGLDLDPLEVSLEPVRLVLTGTVPYRTLSTPMIDFCLWVKVFFFFFFNGKKT